MGQQSPIPIIEYATPVALGSRSGTCKALVRVALFLSIVGIVLMGMLSLWSVEDNSGYGGEYFGLSALSILGRGILFIQTIILLPVILICCHKLARRGEKAMARLYRIGFIVSLVLSLGVYVLGWLPYPKYWDRMFW